MAPRQGGFISNAAVESPPRQKKKNVSSSDSLHTNSPHQPFNKKRRKREKEGSAILIWGGDKRILVDLNITWHEGKPEEVFEKMPPLLPAGIFDILNEMRGDLSLRGNAPLSLMPGDKYWSLSSTFLSAVPRMQKISLPLTCKSY